MRQGEIARLCNFAPAVSNLAAPPMCRSSLVLVGMRLWSANAWDGRMSAITSYSPLLPASERPIGRMAQRTLAMIRAWRSRMRQRSELLLLNAVELRELSLTEADVNQEARRLFWEDIRLSSR